MTESVQTVAEWLQASEENRHSFYRDSFILDVTEQICGHMEEQRISRVTLAETLGKSKSYVSQVLSGNRNMTLATLADVAYALRLQIKMQLTDTRQTDDTWEDFALPKNKSNNIVAIGNQHQFGQSCTYEEGGMIGDRYTQQVAA
jgi:antitoxin component HigA of HigAB toxin-antitoxin module